MAAVVTSLVAFWAGAGPGFPGSSLISLITRNAGEHESEIGAGERRHRSDVWSSSRRDGGLEIIAAVVNPLVFKPEPSVSKAADAGSPKPAPTPWACSVVDDGSSLDKRQPRVAPGALRSPQAAVCSNPRSVQFDLSKNTEHGIQPYSEVYGMHPRDFNFGRGRHVPSACFVDSTCDYESDDDDDDDERAMGPWRAKAQRVLSLRSVPRHIVFAACVMCFLLRAFGHQIFKEYLPDLKSIN
eukprot:CAMPEP_0183436156 /NCGR_PEP_ID=MMETSP0370-20130417/69082_1 /TAXON_ID=268820 /ORGANISM="Peridinium aciculiferum, Strain PAER-2" /LENGTH=240 /DNA_ID=CAMNT_0025623503 /DNA_START=45 /DNA_END=767 /DNA_ORIENTATION=+